METRRFFNNRVYLLIGMSVAQMIIYDIAILWRVRPQAAWTVAFLSLLLLAIITFLRSGQTSRFYIAFAAFCMGGLVNFLVWDTGTIWSSGATKIAQDALIIVGLTAAACGAAYGAIKAGRIDALNLKNNISPAYMATINAVPFLGLNAGFYFGQGINPLLTLLGWAIATLATLQLSRDARIQVRVGRYSKI